VSVDRCLRYWDREAAADQQETAEHGDESAFARPRAKRACEGV
jgi:hypothetical protein